MIWHWGAVALPIARCAVFGKHLIGPNGQNSILEGSLNISGGWEEFKKDNRAFYKYDISAGFNPIIGAKIRVPISPTTVIPRWIKKYGDIYMFVELSGGIALNGHWSRETPDESRAWLEAKGNITGKIGASLFLMKPSVLYCEVAGSTGISFDTRAYNQSSDPGIISDIIFEGIMGLMTIVVAWGFIEINREFLIFDKTTLNKDPIVTDFKSIFNSNT